MNPWLMGYFAAGLTVSTFDAQHRPVASIKVVLQHVGDAKVLTGETDTHGVCHFDVPAGDYTVHAATDSLTKRVTVTGDSAVELVIEPQFTDEPSFTVAGVTDNTYRGGHGSDSVLRSSEDLSKAAASLGEKPSNEKDLLAAVHELELAAERDPSEPNLFNWGTELLSHRALEPAVLVLNKGVRLYPQSLRMLLALGTSYYALGNYQKAADRYIEATDLFPKDAQPYLFLGKVQASEITGLPAYRQRLKRFVELQPDNALANYYHAVALWKDGQGQAAVPLLEKAVRLDSHLEAAYLELGIIHVSQKQYSQAISEFQRAAGLEEAHYRLSEIYRIMGDPIKARQELATYRELSKQSADQREADRRQLQQFVVDLKAH